MTQPASNFESDDAANRGEVPGARPRELDRLDDASAGHFNVRTITGSYLNDLTSRRLMRRPVTLTDQGRSLTWTFNIDGTWLPLVELIECAVGKPMRATVRIRDVDQPLHSSPVQAVEQVVVAPNPVPDAPGSSDATRTTSEADRSADVLPGAAGAEDGCSAQTRICGPGCRGNPRAPLVPVGWERRGPRRVRALSSS